MRVLILWNDLNSSDIEQIADKTGATILRSLSKQESLELAPTADVIFGFASADVLKAATQCRWLQAPYAGAETILAASWGNPEMVYTNGSGIFGPCISEHVLGFILAFNRGLHLARDHQNQRLWQPRLSIPFRELTGATVGVLGYGDLGRQVAKRLSGFDCRVLGFRQHPKGSEPYAEAVYGLERFDQLLPEFDYLVCTLPHTEKTIGFLDKSRMQRLPKHAIIVNVGRGSLIPVPDLLQALKEGWIAGAALDVTDPEPLPPESPLWGMANVIITPHNSGFTAFHKERALKLFLDNWRSFQNGGVPTINVVSRTLGY